MENKIIFSRENSTQKNPKHLQKNVFVTYSPKTVKIEPASSIKIETELTVFLPQNSKEFLTAIIRGNEINELFYGKIRLWVDVLSTCFEDTIKIKKNQSLGCLVVETEN